MKLHLCYQTSKLLCDTLTSKLSLPNRDYLCLFFHTILHTSSRARQALTRHIAAIVAAESRDADAEPEPNSKSKRKGIAKAAPSVPLSRRVSKKATVQIDILTSRLYSDLLHQRRHRLGLASNDPVRMPVFATVKSPTEPFEPIDFRKAAETIEPTASVGQDGGDVMSTGPLSDFEDDVAQHDELPLPNTPEQARAGFVLSPEPPMYITAGITFSGSPAVPGSLHPQGLLVETPRHSQSTTTPTNPRKHALDWESGTSGVDSSNGPAIQADDGRGGSASIAANALGDHLGRGQL